MQSSFKVILTAFFIGTHLALAIPVENFATVNQTSMTTGPGGGPGTSEWALICGSASTEDYCKSAPYYYHCDGGTIDHDQYALTCWVNCVCGQISEHDVALAVPLEKIAARNETSLSTGPSRVENMTSGNKISLTTGPGGGPVNSERALQCGTETSEAFCKGPP
ncbi:hypothetical protein MMC17_004431 [Xylographa soralifera]|nr:hypothetical protein [Xylographa soralifera]